MTTTAAMTTRKSVSLRSVLTALLGNACSQGCTPAEAPASLEKDKNVCACARNGLQFEEIDGSITVSMTVAALTALRRAVKDDLESLVAKPDQRYKFAFDGTHHRVAIKKKDLCRMVEEIWKAKTGLSIKVDDVTVDRLVAALDNAA